MTLNPVYVLTGSEPLLQKMFVDDLRRKIFPEGSGGFNDDQFDAKEKTWEEIFDLANTFPMFATKRMITVQRASDFKADDEDVWAAYLKNPPEHTVLILQAEKLDKRKKVTKLLEKSGYLHDMLPPKLQMMPGWVDKIAEQKGLKVQPKAKMALVDAIGTNLSRLDKELDKLELFSYPEKQITDEAVSKLVLKSTGDNIFQFTDYIFEKKTKEAITTLNYLLSDGTPGLVILSMLVRHVRILTQIREMIDQKQRPESNASALGIPPFRISNYVSQARPYTLTKLQSFTAKMMNLDREFKSTGFSAQLLLEKTILDFQK